MKFFQAAIIIFLFSNVCTAQNLRDYHRIAFYNVENLFDTLDTPLKSDEEFTPKGSKEWNTYRLRSKILKTYKVIVAIGKWQLPAVVGFAEIENSGLLKMLLTETPLVKYNYEYISEDSDDKRGIETGLIFRKDIFTYLCHDKIKVPLGRPTRDILYVKGKIGHQNYHIYVNHWPSRIGGKEHTDQLRIKASKVLTNHISMIALHEDAPKFILMGDFNDEIDDSSLASLINKTFLDKSGNKFQIKENEISGHQGTVTFTTVDTQWFMFDHILISDHLKSKDLKIFKPEWLFDKTGKPYRTYLGDYYNGGFSDHLPVYLDIYTE